MIEATTNPAVRDAMINADMERTKAIQEAWIWLFAFKSSH